MHYIVYRNDTGEIERVGETTVDIWRRQLGASDEAIVEVDGKAKFDLSPFSFNGRTIMASPRVALDSDDYVDLESGEIRVRPVLPLSDGVMAADGVSEHVLAVPAGTQLTLDGEIFEVSDGEIVLVTDEPRIFDLEIRPPFPIKPLNIRVVAE